MIKVTDFANTLTITAKELAENARARRAADMSPEALARRRDERISAAISRRADSEFHGQVKEKELYLPVPEGAIGKKIEKLPSSDVLEARSQAALRIEMGMRPLKIATRTCLTCGIWFESLGNRKCQYCNKIDAMRGPSTLMGHTVEHLHWDDPQYRQRGG